MPKTTPIKSIHRYCKEVCMLDNLREIPKCTCLSCPLYPYRNGKRPKEDEIATLLKEDKSSK